MAMRCRTELRSRENQRPCLSKVSHERRTSPNLARTNNQERKNKMSNLNAMAVLASLHVGKWSGRKTDAQATGDLCEREKASRGAVKVNKTLVFGELFDQIRDLETKARKVFYSSTLPWTDDGARILAAKTYVDVTSRFADFRDEYMRLADKVAAAIEGEKGEAKARLGGLYKEEDYPTIEEIRDKYHFEFTCSPIPTGSALAGMLGAAEREALAAQITDRVKGAEAAAKRDIYDRITTVVGKMAEVLPRYDPTQKGKDKGTFRDSLVDNVRELTDTLEDLNYDNDPRVTEIRKTIEAKALRYTADELRESAKKREEVAASAADILAAMTLAAKK